MCALRNEINTIILIIISQTVQFFAVIKKRKSMQACIGSERYTSIKMSVWDHVVFPTSKSHIVASDVSCTHTVTHGQLDNMWWCVVYLWKYKLNRCNNIIESIIRSPMFPLMLAYTSNPIMLSTFKSINHTEI